MLLLKPDKELLVVAAIRRGASRFSAMKKATGLADGELDRLLKRLREKGFVLVQVAERVGSRIYVDYRLSKIGERHAGAAAAGLATYERAMAKAGLDTSELQRVHELLASGP